MIPARGGSKSVSRKNVKDFLGKPLLAWTIEVALESGVFERVILSTDDEAIGKIGQAYGAEVPFLRPQELAEDSSLTAPVIRHGIEWLERHENWVPDFVLVLEPTSPGRRSYHIRESGSLLLESGADSLASVSELPHHYNPDKVLKVHSDGTITGIDGTHVRDMVHRRQELPTYYAFNGIIFACKTAVVLANQTTLWGDKIVAYLVDQKYNLDIDSPNDWIVAEAQMRKILEEERTL